MLIISSNGIADELLRTPVFFNDAKEDGKKGHRFLAVILSGAAMIGLSSFAPAEQKPNNSNPAKNTFRAQQIPHELPIQIGQNEKNLLALFQELGYRIDTEKKRAAVQKLTRFFSSTSMHFRSRVDNIKSFSEPERYSAAVKDLMKDLWSKMKEDGYIDVSKQNSPIMLLLSIIYDEDVFNKVTKNVGSKERKEALSAYINSSKTGSLLFYFMLQYLGMNNTRLATGDSLHMFVTVRIPGSELTATGDVSLEIFNVLLLSSNPANAESFFINSPDGRWALKSKYLIPKENVSRFVDESNRGLIQINPEANLASLKPILNLYNGFSDDDQDLIAQAISHMFFKIQEELEEDIKFWKENARINPTAGAFIKLGDIYNQYGRRKDAAEAYEKAVTIDPVSLDVWIKLSSARTKYGNIEGAVIAAQKAIEIDTSSARAWSELGEAYLFSNKKENMPLAVEAYSRAISIDPMVYSIYKYSILSAYEKAEDINNALRTALENAADFKSAGSYLDMGRLYFKSGGPANLALARGALEQALAMKKDYVDAMIYLGLVYYSSPGEKDKAIAIWVKAYKINPGVLKILPQEVRNIVKLESESIAMQGKNGKRAYLKFREDGGPPVLIVLRSRTSI